MRELSLSPKLTLSTLPTPLEKLETLSAELGLELYIKRDDLTSSAGGGNKVRKLEYLLADALYQGAKTVLTIGAVQSNHCRQTALLGAKLGLQVHLVLVGQMPEQTQGNILLDSLAGAHLHFASGGREAGEVVLSRLFEDLKAKGAAPYIIPYGGSNEIGAQGYISAWMELEKQSREIGIDFDFLVLPVSSGGTMAGVLIGEALTKAKVQTVGISVGPTREELRLNLKTLIESTLIRLGLDIETPEFQLRDEFVGKGYAVFDEETRTAIETVARKEGLLLDPVYTGKAFRGLLTLARRKEIGGRVLFWHTGGLPALYAYASYF